MKRYLYLAAGTFLMAAAYKSIYQSVGMVTGGFSGIGVIVNRVTGGVWAGGVPLWITNVTLNVPLFIAAFYIEGKELVLHKGDVLMLNQQVVHSIKRADYQDIGINFIALPEFFEIPLSMLGEENVLARFVTGVFRQKDPVSHYLLFRLQENEQVENLMENMVESMLHGYADEDIINQYSMGIVFLYLLKHLENLSHNSSMDYKETVVQAVLGYINSDCKNASLTRIAEETHQSMTTLSKLIKEKTGYNFQELLQRKRFQMTVLLLCDTKLSIEEIALDCRV